MNPIIYLILALLIGILSVVLLLAFMYFIDVVIKAIISGVCFTLEAIWTQTFGRIKISEKIKDTLGVSVCLIFVALTLMSFGFIILRLFGVRL